MRATKRRRKARALRQAANLIRLREVQLRSVPAAYHIRAEHNDAAGMRRAAELLEGVADDLDPREKP